MKHIKYLNGILTIIAFCLIIITLAVTGLIPTVSAKQPTNNKVAQIPVNSDGSITVKFASTSIMDVNIKQLGDMDVLLGALDVNIAGINRRYVPLSVKVEP